MGLSVVPQPAVVSRECLPWLAVEIAVEVAVDLAVEVAVEFAMASAMGLDGVPLHAAAIRGSPWNFRGSPSSVRVSAVARGMPWRPMGTAAVLVQKE